MITPQSLQDKINAKNAPAVRSAIQRLEAELERSAEMYGDATKASATLAISSGQGVNRHVAEQVVQQFISNGWSAEIINDNRDGDYIKVSYRAPVRPKRVIPMTAESNIVPAYGFPTERLY